MKVIAKLFAITPLLLIFSCAEEVTVKEYLRPIKYHEVGYLGGENIRTFSGTSEIDISINLSFRNGGIITLFDIRLGQQVKKGQLLAKLDNVESRLNYESAIASKNSAESEMNTAKLNLDRIRKLYESGSSSLSDYESAKNSYKTASESFESSKRSVDIQQEYILYGYLYAPEDGTISEVNAEIDENVTASQRIATLSAGTDMEIALGLPESVINGVAENMEVGVTLTALPGQQFKGIVTEVSPTVDSNLATYPVTVAVTNPTDAIRSGMAADVTFDFSDKNKGQDTKKALVVPTHAVGEDSNGRFVFLIEEEGKNVKVKKHPITIGTLSGEGFEVKSGLSFGQKIATAGLQTLLDGQVVKL
ncbi:MAG: efflux RND transporter periplasmic adaptor subunit [Bacteroidota bacterium]